MSRGGRNARAAGIPGVLVSQEACLAGGLGKNGEHKAHEDCDDGNHHEYLNEQHPHFDVALTSCSDRFIGEKRGSHIKLFKWMPYPIFVGCV